MAQSIHTDIGIDWLSYTIRCRADQIVDTASWWIAYLGGDPDSAYDGGLFGYTRECRVLGSGRVMWHPDRPEMYVHIMLPSSALSRLQMAPLDFLASVRDLNGRVTRLDVCLDTDRVGVEGIMDAIDGGEVVTRLRRGIRVEQFDVADPSAEGGGMTIYLGSPQSDRRVRIYDKAAEQGVTGVWTRVEVQHRSDHADIAASHLLEGSSPLDLIVSAVDFRQGGTDSNVSRRDRSPWWSEIVTALADRVSFALQDIGSSIQKSAEWVERQIGPTLAMLVTAMNGEMHWLRDMIDRSYDRLDAWRMDQARQYQVLARVDYENFGLCHSG